MRKELSDLVNIRLKKLSKDSGQELLPTMMDYLKAYSKFEIKALVKYGGVDAYNWQLAQEVAFHSLDVLERLYRRKYK